MHWICAVIHMNVNATLTRVRICTTPCEADQPGLCVQKHQLCQQHYNSHTHYIHLDDLKATSLDGTAEPKHPCQVSKSNYKMLHFIHSDIKHTDELSLTTFCCHHDCCHELCFKLKTLTLYSKKSQKIHTNEHFRKV